MNTRAGPLWVCTAISLYLLGAACLLLATVYPLLAEVQTGLPAFHASLSRRLGVAFILPEFLSALSPLLLLWRRPERVPLASVGLCVGLGVGWLALTFTWHLPVHRLLAQGDASPEVMNALLTSHATRTLLQALKCGVLLWMVARRETP